MEEKNVQLYLIVVSELFITFTGSYWALIWPLQGRLLTDSTFFH